jgi:hypothetical protein
LLASQEIMPFRSFIPQKTQPAEHEEAEPPPEKRSLWRTGLLLATSAALGGIAVALWDRRTLAQMRQQPPSPNEYSDE